jgi:RPA family protein
MAGFSREVARRIFLEELKGSNYSFRDGEDQHQYAPQYVLTPTGAKCNRVFLVGTLTERDDIGGDTEYWRGRVVDPTGSILIYAGQYQPEAAQILANIEPPAFVAVVGKPSLYQTEDGNIIISVRAEAIQPVDESTRNQWILDTARRTEERLKSLKSTGSASPEFSTADKAASQAMDADRALQHYNTDIGQYKQMVIRALNSLRADLLKNEGAAPAKAQAASSGSKEKSEVMETGAPKTVQAAKPEVSKKVRPKSKGSLSDWPQAEDVETVDLARKS